MGKTISANYMYILFTNRMEKFMRPRPGRQKKKSTIMTIQYLTKVLGNGQPLFSPD